MRSRCFQQSRVEPIENLNIWKPNRVSAAWIILQIKESNQNLLSRVEPCELSRVCWAESSRLEPIQNLISFRRVEPQLLGFPLRLTLTELSRLDHLFSLGRAEPSWVVPCRAKRAEPEIFYQRCIFSLTLNLSLFSFSPSLLVSSRGNPSRAESEPSRAQMNRTEPSQPMTNWAKSSRADSFLARLGSPISSDVQKTKYRKMSKHSVSCSPNHSNPFILLWATGSWISYIINEIWENWVIFY